MATAQRPRRRRRSGTATHPGRDAHNGRSSKVSLRKVLIATDGSRASSAAIKLARAMAAQGLWAPRVITVTAPLPVAVGDTLLPAPDPNYLHIADGSVLAGIREQVRRHGDAHWPTTMELGRAAPTIVEVAAREKAELIVLGLGTHGRLGRVFGAETAARVARHAAVPVVAVHERTSRAPHVAMAAVDFGGAGVNAAREALAMLQPPGRLHLVHVKWQYNTTSFADSEWERAYEAAAQAQFAALREKIGRRTGIDVSERLRTGNVIENVLDEARAVGAELIALGSHAEEFVERLLIGSTPAQLLRAARCSVLIAPPTGRLRGA